MEANNEELHTFFMSQTTDRMTKWRMRWMEHVARMGEKGNHTGNTELRRLVNFHERLKICKHSSLSYDVTE
jgi:hypothetical protein